MKSAMRWVLVSAVLGCGGGGAGTATPQNAQVAQSSAFQSEECHVVWQHPKDARGQELPYESTEGGGPAWAKGPALPASGKREQLALDVICFDAIAPGDTFKRYVAFDDRRFDVVDASLLVDACVESGQCASDEMIAGALGWYARQLELTRVSAAAQKLDMSQPARDAFVDRTLKNAKTLATFLASLPAPRRAYADGVPSSVHDLAAAYEKEHTDDYAQLDRMLERPSITALVTLRSDAAARCVSPDKCNVDPFYREVTRAVVRAYMAANNPVAARATALSVGAAHAARGRTQTRVWAAQSAYRKLHPELPAPPPVTEEGDDETASANVDVASGDLASASGKGTTKLVLKDAPAGKRCDDSAEIESFEGAIEQTRVIYKQACADVPAQKGGPLLVPEAEASGLKPGVTILAASTGAGDARKGDIIRVTQGTRVIQIGPDKFLQTTGDPLKGQP